jgi:hypothetical protein
MNIQQKNKPVNLEDRDARLQKVAGYTKIALEAMTMSELRELGAYLIPNARKLKKPEFIEALLEISASYREDRLKESLLTLELMERFDFDTNFIQSCFIKGITPQQCSDIIGKKFDSGNYAPSTIAKTKMKQLRELLSVVKAQNVESLEWCDSVYDAMREYAAKYHTEVNKNYSQTVENYGTSETIRHIESKPLINWSKEVIDWACEQKDLYKGWHKVSFALAVTSGRRMDEIHGDCEFEVVDTHTLKSIGLSKKRTEDAELIAPCLVDASKWVKALYLLPEERRHQPNSVVNGIIRRAIKDSIGGQIENLGLETYKDSRDFYVAYLIATQFDKLEDGTHLAFAKKLLGHESKKQTLSYEKMVIVDA